MLGKMLLVLAICLDVLRSSENSSPLGHFSSTPLHPYHFLPNPNLSFSIDLLLVQSLSTLLDVLIRRWCVLFIGIQWLIRSLASGAAVLHPQENDRLANQHSDGGSSHAESDTNQDGYQDDFEGGPKDHVYTVSDTFMVMMVTMIMRLELDVGRELHSAIW